MSAAAAAKPVKFRTSFFDDDSRDVQKRLAVCFVTHLVFLGFALSSLQK